MWRRAPHTRMYTYRILSGICNEQIGLLFSTMWHARLCNFVSIIDLFWAQYMFIGTRLVNDAAPHKGLAGHTPLCQV